MLSFRLNLKILVFGVCALCVTSANTNTVAFIEPTFVNDTATLSRISSIVAEKGGLAFQRLSMMAWSDEDFAPTPSNPLPPPDGNTTAFLRNVRSSAPAGFKVWGGINLCPGRAFECMLNYSNSEFVGTELGKAALSSGLDGVQIYVSPYCNNANCKRTTGKYATGIAKILSAAKAAAPGLETAVILNEWDNPQIVAAMQPTAIFSYQTIYYFTSVSDCKAQCGSLCGAGENSAYVIKDGKNWTDILTTLAKDNISWLGQMRGASTPDSGNPSDFWPALEAYTAGTLVSVSSTSFSTANISYENDKVSRSVNVSVSVSQSPLNFLALGDWGGGPLWYLNYTTVPQHQVAAGMTLLVDIKNSQFVLALGDNMYPLGLCNNETLAPYNNTCANATNPLAGTEFDPRIQLTFEDVYSSSELRSINWFPIAGNHVSNIIIYEYSTLLT
jgi:hypothetical protein